MQHADSVVGLARLVAASEAHFIAIDGAHGSGKSTLAKALSWELNARVIEADHFLTPNQGSYLLHLDFESLSRAVDPKALCILEGICLRQVMMAAMLEPQLYIYVKRMARWGWADETELVVEGPIESHLQRLKADAASFVDPETTVDLGLWEEVIRYHATYRPHETCDFIYLRGET